MDFIIAPRARADIMNILAWTEESFGALAMERYAKLIEIGIAAVAEDPELVGSICRAEIAENCRTYHLLHVRKKARVGKPRHLLLYRVSGSVVEVSRVLHDSMDLEQHVSAAYRGQDG